MNFLYKLWGFIIWVFSYFTGLDRARFMVAKFSTYLRGKTILDFGCGMGHIGWFLSQLKWEVTLLDVAIPYLRSGQLGQRLVAIPHAKFISQKYNLPYQLYDGSVTSFGDNTFDNAVVAFVLHHTEDIEMVLREVLRVTKNRVIVLEDLPKDKSEAKWNKLFDAVVNLELFGHPHQNRTKEEWLSVFSNCGAKVVAEDTWTHHLMMMPFPNVMFILEK